MSLVEDLRNIHLSLPEILKKHELTFKELVTLCEGEYERISDYRYIYLKKNKYVIQKFVHNKMGYFGTYNTLVEAISARDKLEAVNWDRKKVETELPLTYVSQGNGIRYTLWDAKKVGFTRLSSPESYKCFKVRYKQRHVRAGMFIDFLSCEIIYDLIMEFK